ncbi:transcriptional regulator [Corallococcus sp. H22C18031201]|uniref:helix-turn-helix transcriptional regulator n=1 Tax=Citreicoccus inhibens TaxID=2849499 RepID=UPI000E738410|nr:helix-turn-helix transcriptional regulator [Citreicoccus inhibens]MBU8897337.1 helix-turn-helix domain-containing protein [Citreicoccus inhibens]RJS21106.1 transcriptional regulator [Corallococcus sp. H22C18031201]
MNEELAIIVGEAAREARERLHLSQADVASRVGIALEVYARIERGRVLPSATTLRRLCRVLSVRADTLLGLEPTSPMAGAEEDSPRLRRLLGELRELDGEQLGAVTRMVRDALVLVRR